MPISNWKLKDTIKTEIATKLREFSLIVEPIKKQSYINAAMAVENEEIDFLHPNNTFGIGTSIGKKIHAMYLNNNYTFCAYEEFKNEIQEKLIENYKNKKRKYDKIKKIPREKAIEIIKDFYFKNGTHGKSIKESGAVGSIRRKNNFVSDIDLLYAYKDIEEISDINKFFSNNKEILPIKINQMGTQKTSLIYKDFQIDINFCDIKELGTQLLHHTGSVDFNILLRKRAKKLGYKLNQHNIEEIENKNIYNFYNEKSVFSFLKISYVKPENRKSILEKIFEIRGEEIEKIIKLKNKEEVYKNDNLNERINNLIVIRG